MGVKKKIIYKNLNDWMFMHIDVIIEKAHLKNKAMFNYFTTI